MTDLPTTLSAAQAEITRLRAELAASPEQVVRDEALEEAATAVDLYQMKVADMVLSGKGSVPPTEALDTAADAIRAMKGGQ